MAAPLAGMTLAGLGWEVIRVDPPGGGLDYRRWPITRRGVSRFWAGLNRGKRSVLIDIRHEEGRELAAGLVLSNGPEGGTLLTNLGTRGALRYEVLRERRPDVIAVEIEGQRDGRSAVDYTVAAETGVPYLTGPANEAGPINSPVPTWDIATGLNAALAVQEAVWQRRVTGQGQNIRLALADVALGALRSLGFVEDSTIVEGRARDGNYLYGAFGRDFALRDGSQVMIVAITRKQWQSLVAATGLAGHIHELERDRGLDLDDEGNRYRLRHEIAGLVEGWCAARDLRDAGNAFEQHGVCWSSYGSPATFAQSAPAGDPTGSAHAFGDEALSSLPAAPRLGSDTEWALAELLGLVPAEIGRLYERGVAAPAEGGHAHD